MNPWTAAVQAIASALLSTGEALGGGRTLGIVVGTFVMRATLIPVLAPLAVRTRNHQRVLRSIRPQIKELDRVFKDDPRTLSARLTALHQDNGIGMVDWPGLGAAMIQLPILIALFQAVLVLWAPEAMTLDGLGLGLLAGGLSVLSAKVSGQADSAWMMVVFGLLPVAICLWLGAGVGFYLIAFYAASAVQGLFMRQVDRSGGPAES